MSQQSCFLFIILFVMTIYSLFRCHKKSECTESVCVCVGGGGGGGVIFISKKSAVVKRTCTFHVN